MAHQTRLKTSWSFVSGVIWMAIWFGLIGLIVRYGKLWLNMSDAPSLDQVGLLAILGGVIGAVERVFQVVGSRMRKAACSGAVN